MSEGALIAIGAGASAARCETDPLGIEESSDRGAEGPEASVPEAGWDRARGGRTGCMGGIPGTAVRAETGAAACSACAGGGGAAGSEGLATGAGAGGDLGGGATRG